MADRLLVRELSGAPRAILIDGDRIAALDADAQERGADRIIVGRDLTAHPGFVELQVNGIDELDFTSDPASVRRAGARLARHGVTAFLPTIVSSPHGTVEAALEQLRAAESEPGAVPLGLHVEGPFISPARHGAHDPAYLRDPDPRTAAQWAEAGTRLLTLAPELPGALPAIEAACSAGAVAAIGHTDADAATTAEAVEAGARYATHLFNAMPPLGHRDPGSAGMLLADERVTIGLIGDGVHVDPLVLAIVARAASGRVSLVSDGVGHRLGDAVVHGGRLDDGTLAGGLDGLDHAVRTFAAVAGLEAALAAVTEVPARLLGLDDGRGALRVGGRADVVLLTPELEVAATIVGGIVVHDRLSGAGGAPRTG